MNEKLTATARVEVTLLVPAARWDPDSPASQIHRDASREAVGLVGAILRGDSRSGHGVRIIGDPRVTVVTAEQMPPNDEIKEKWAAKPAAAAAYSESGDIDDDRLNAKAMDRANRSIRFAYVNHAGFFGIRHAVPQGITWRATEHHPEAQWIMRAWDLDKDGWRDFALRDCAFEHFDVGKAQGNIANAATNLWSIGVAVPNIRRSADAAIEQMRAAYAAVGGKLSDRQEWPTDAADDDIPI